MPIKDPVIDYREEPVVRVDVQFVGEDTGWSWMIGPNDRWELTPDEISIYIGDRREWHANRRNVAFRGVEHTTRQVITPPEAPLPSDTTSPADRQTTMSSAPRARRGRRRS